MSDLFAPAPPLFPHPAAAAGLLWTGDHAGRAPCYRGAVFSPCRRYRSALWRLWNPALPFVQFVCLNPSTADERADDPTVRRVMRFAEQWGFGGVVMTNLFAFRATDPRDMKAQVSPVDPPDLPGWNDAEITRIAERSVFAVLAFGTHGRHSGRAEAFARSLRHVRASHGHAVDVRALALNRDGTPGHPLYLRADSDPLPFDIDGFLLASAG